MSKKINIIGGGIAGLSAGCYLQMNGYETEIFESHTIPGGLCTAWEKNGFTMDTCIHWLVGSSPSDNFYFLWNELVDMKKIQFVDSDVYVRMVDSNGDYVDVYENIDKFEKELITKSPQDKEIILEFANAVRKFSKLNMPNDIARETMTMLDSAKFMTKMLPYMGDFNKWLKITASEYADRFKNPLLKYTFQNIFVPEMAHIFIIFCLVWFNKKSAGYPIGGSLNFSRLIEKRYLGLGGKINYSSIVKKVLYYDSQPAKAKGIMLKSGEVHNSDLVISAADGHSTIFEMLEGKFLNEKISDYYNYHKVFSSYIQVSLGLNRTFDNEVSHYLFKLNSEIEIDNKTKTDSISCRIFNFDQTLAPKGKTVITSMVATENYEYWVNLRKSNNDLYQKEKERVANEIINILEEKIGNIKNNIEIVDVSSPATVIRYTNNWKGSFEGWILTPKIGIKLMSKELPGLKNFYMIGQWVEPGGGLPAALLSGRNVAQIICKRDKIKFRTEHF